MQTPPSRTAVVTGGESGIGRAVATALAAQGNTVYSLDLAAGEPHDGAIEHIPCDVTDEDSVNRAVATISAASSAIDVLVNNAGVAALGSLEENTLDDWQRVFNVNVFGPVRVTRALLPLLRKGRHPVVVNNCSATASVGLINRTLYSASKGAIRSLTLSLAADLVGEGIRVNSVEPGSVDTPLVHRRLAAAEDPEAVFAELAAFQPIGRLVTAEEVAFAVCYLASEHSASSTGVTLPVDGGLSAIRL